MAPQDKSSSPLCNESPWNNNANQIWLGSTLTLTRNIDKFKFPGKLEEDKKKQVVSLLSQPLLKSSDLNHPQLIQAESMSSNEKEFLVEHFLSNQGFEQASAGEAFILDRTGEFLGGLNLNDHLLLKWIDTRDEIEKCWEKLVRIESELNQTINFAFSTKFGFLTSDPGQSGTAFAVTLFLHLPALLYSEQSDEMFEKNRAEGIELTGLQGDPNDMIGDIVAFHNKYTIGLTEESLLSSLRSAATKYVAEEQQKRKQLLKGTEGELAEIKDRVSRAYAILLHSYQIEAIEALEAISLLKLGTDLNWIKGTSHAVLNKLLFGTRRAHLMCQFEQKIEQEKLPHKRAEYIHKQLNGVELLI